MPRNDPLAHLEHDHAHLSLKLAFLREQLTALAAESATAGPSTASFLEALTELTEELFEHFAREEEGLFPFVVREVPELDAPVRALIEAHDRICGAASRILALRSQAGATTTFEVATATFRRFDEVYTDHVRSEVEFLRTVAERLDASRREKLAALMVGI